ncbi:MAG: hypothetical protein QW051_00810 [Candidatus Aenigmatarchaeota archaeon]
MVYKRYIKKNGKIYGPYYYKSYRDANGNVYNVYVGKTKKSEKNEKKLVSVTLKKNYIRVFLIILLISLIIFSHQIIYRPTGFIIYPPKEKINETLVLEINQFVPKESILKIEFENQKFEYPITFFIKRPSEFQYINDELVEGYSLGNLALPIDMLEVPEKEGVYPIFVNILYRDEEIFSAEKDILIKMETKKTEGGKIESEEVLEEFEKIGESEILVEKNFYENFEEIVIQQQAEIDKPVKWVKRIKAKNEMNLIVDIPSYAKDIKIIKVKDGEKTFATMDKIKFLSPEKIEIGESAKVFEIEYYTDAPKSEHIWIKPYRKLVKVYSEFDYKNVITYTEVDDVPKESIAVYWIKENGKERIYDVEYIDENLNGFIDKIKWITPHLSNQTFEVDITIINTKSYPQVGGNWTVLFSTFGEANLTITAINGTKWSKENENYDLKFLEIKCGEQQIPYTWIENDYGEGSVFIENYSCEENSSETSLVLTSGHHYLEFKFGDLVAYAENKAGDPCWYDNSTNATYAGTYISHNVRWTSDAGLSGYVFSWYNGANWTDGNCADYTSENECKAFGCEWVVGPTPTYYINETDIVMSTTGTTYVEYLPLYFTPESGSNYLIIGYAEGILNNTAYQLRVQFLEDSTIRAQYLDRPRVANTERMPFHFVYVLSGTGSQKKISIAFSVSTAGFNASMVRARLIAIRLDNLPNTHYNYSYVSTEQANVNNVWGDAAGDTDEITLNVQSPGLYMIISTAKVESDSTTGLISYRLNIDNGQEYIPYPIGTASGNFNYSLIYDTNTAEEVSFGLFALRWLDAGSHSIKAQVADGDATASADWAYRSLVAVRLTGVFPFFNASSITQATTTSTSYQNYTVLNGVNYAGNYLVLGGITIQSSSNAYDHLHRLVIDGIEYNLIQERTYNANNYLARIMMQNITFGGGNHWIASQYRSSNTAQTTRVKNSDLAAIYIGKQPDYCRGTPNYEFKNDSWIAFEGNPIEAWSNVTKLVNETVGALIKWKIYANDSAGNWNVTDVFYYYTTGLYPQIQFVDPTPQNNSIRKENWVYINVSADQNLQACLLEWNSLNESMTVEGNICYINKTSLPEGPNLYRVYANNSLGNINFTEERLIHIDYPPRFSQNSTNSTNGDDFVEHRIYIEDSNSVSGCIFSFSNCTAQYDYNWTSSDQETEMKRLNTTLNSIIIEKTLYLNFTLPYENATAWGRSATAAHITTTGTTSFTVNYANLWAQAQYNLTQVGYNNLKTQEGYPGVTNFTSAGANNEPFGIFNFTIPSTIDKTQINWIWITMTQAATLTTQTEACYYYLNYHGNASLLQFGPTTTGTTLVTRSVNITSTTDINNLLGNGKDISVTTLSADADASEGCVVDFVGVIIGYNETLYLPNYEQNTSWIFYENIDGEDYDRIDLVKAIITINSYNPSASNSTYANNLRPDIEVGFWNGSEYIDGFYCKINESMGNEQPNTTKWNCTTSTNDEKIKNAWKFANERKIRIRGVWLDSYNENIFDEINVSDVYAYVDGHNYTINYNFLNDSWIEINQVNAWFNVTKKTAPRAGCTVYWMVSCNDSNNNWAYSEIFSYVTTDTKPPYYISPQDNSSGKVNEGGDVLISAYWNDSLSNLNFAILRTNESGNWENKSYFAFSTKPQYSNFTFNTNGLGGKTICWVIWANDSYGNLNNTMEAKCFYVNKAPIISIVSITPSQPKTIDTLDCGALGNDYEGDSLKTNFTWYIDTGSGYVRWTQDDENEVPTINSVFVNTSSVGDIEPSDTQKYYKFKCEATIYDDSGAYAKMNSSEVVIQNSPPNPDSNWSPTTTHNPNQQFNWIEGSDDDNDEVTSFICIDDDQNGRDNFICDIYFGIGKNPPINDITLTYGGEYKTYYGRLIANDGESNSSNYDFSFNLTNAQPSPPHSASLENKETNDTTPTISFMKGVDSDTNPIDNVVQFVSVDSNGFTDNGNIYTTSGDISEFTIPIELSDGVYYVRQWADDQTGASNSRSQNYEYTFTVKAKVAIVSMEISPDEGDPGIVVNPVEASNKSINVTVRIANSTSIHTCEIRIFNSTGSYQQPIFKYFGTIQNCSSTCDCFKEWEMEYWRNYGDWNVSVFVNVSNGAKNFTSLNFTYNILISINANVSNIIFVGIPDQTVNSTNAYPMGIQNTGNQIVNISVKGDDFVGLSNPNYIVGVGNSTYSEYENGIYKSLSKSFERIFENLSPSQNRTMFFRAYLPLGFLSQIYQNTIEFSTF